MSAEGAVKWQVKFGDVVLAAFDKAADANAYIEQHMAAHKGFDVAAYSLCCLPAPLKWGEDSSAPIATVLGRASALGVKRRRDQEAQFARDAVDAAWKHFLAEAPKVADDGHNSFIVPFPTKWQPLLDAKFKSEGLATAWHWPGNHPFSEEKVCTVSWQVLPLDTE